MSFASWARVSGCGVGYIAGTETFCNWAKHFENHAKIDIVAAEDVVPSRELAREVTSIGQQKMPNCKGITFFGYKPHLKYDPQARAKVGLSPIVDPEPTEHSNNNSMNSVSVTEETWDLLSDEDANYQYL